jgi:hypothetical protein
MSATTRPRDQVDLAPSPTDEDAYRQAIEEARAQAEALRRAVCAATDLIRQLEELVESLRAILVYPTAYHWPPMEPSEVAEIPAVEPAAEVTVLEPDDRVGPPS